MERKRIGADKPAGFKPFQSDMDKDMNTSFSEFGSVSPTNQVSSQTVNSRNSSMSVSHDRTNQSDSRMSYASETGAPESGELIQTKYIERVNIELNLEAGTLLPLALRLVNFRNN